MNWITNFVRPKLKELVGGGKAIPDNLWRTCDQCGQMIFHRELEKNQRVCPHCDFHMRLGAKERLGLLLDEGQYELLDLPKTAPDPLRFRDLRRYPDRLKDAQGKTGQPEALMVATGTVSQIPTVVAVLNFDFLGGSMGTAVGNGLVTAASHACSEAEAFVVVCASGGARMQEGILSLMQMARTTLAVEQVREAGLPYVVILTDPTTGGVSASFAMLGDVSIAEPGAVIGFAGARVIQQTIRESLPEGFQKAEYLLEHGMLDMVVHRHQIRDTLGRVLTLLRRPRPIAGGEQAVDLLEPSEMPADAEQLTTRASTGGTERAHQA